MTSIKINRAAIAVFALLLGVYLLTTGGHLYAIDEETMFALSESLALHGSFALNAGSSAAPIYSTYGPAQSIIALPWYAVGRFVAQFWPPEAYEWLTRVAVSWFNPLVTALVAALLVVAVGRLGFGRATAIGTALIYGLGTMAWPHSKTFFAEPLTALVLFGSFLLMLTGAAGNNQARKGRTAGSLTLVASGVLAGLAPAIKIQAGIALPLLGLFLLLRSDRQIHAMAGTQRNWRFSNLFGFVGFVLKRNLGRTLVWGVSAIIPLVLLALYQDLAFGSPLRTGYGTVGSGFTTPFWLGFNGQIWSIGRGIIWYAPVTLLFPVGLWLLSRRFAGIALLCLAMVGAHLLFYATWWAWHGAGAWGPRFFNAVLPFFVLPLAPFLASLRWSRVRRFALATLLIASVPVQFAGLAINLNAYFSLTSARDVDYFRPADSAIIVHLGLAADYATRFYNRFFAPNSVALQSGVSYSEGGAAQLPRWTNAQATIGVRASGSAPTRLTLILSSCAAPLPVTVQPALDGQTIGAALSACPAQTLELLVPAGNHALTLAATPWNPAAFGSDRDETLGVRLEDLAAQAGTTTLAVRGDAFAPTPMPNGHNSFRRWMGDHRSANWDFWWWYMQHTRYPASHLLALAAVWFAAAIGAFVSGLWVVLRR